MKIRHLSNDVLQLTEARFVNPAVLAVGHGAVARVPQDAMRDAIRRARRNE